MTFDPKIQLREVKYLGYGVYVGIDRTTDELCLCTSREDGWDRINLTRDEFKALTTYVAHIPSGEF